MNKKYESPEIKVVSMEPDESLMDLGGDIGDGEGTGTPSFGSGPMPGFK